GRDKAAAAEDLPDVARRQGVLARARAEDPPQRPPGEPVVALEILLLEGNERSRERRDRSVEARMLQSELECAVAAHRDPGDGSSRRPLEHAVARGDLPRQVLGEEPLEPAGGPRGSPKPPPPP